MIGDIETNIDEAKKSGNHIFEYQVYYDGDIKKMYTAVIICA